MDITNNTKKALKVPLPGGKTLFLAPGKTGQVTAKALLHPPLVALLESGDLESFESVKQKVQGGMAPAAGSGARHGGSGAMRQSGDR